MRDDSAVQKPEDLADSIIASELVETTKKYFSGASCVACLTVLVPEGPSPQQCSTIYWSASWLHRSYALQPVPSLTCQMFHALQSGKLTFGGSNTPGVPQR